MLWPLYTHEIMQHALNKSSLVYFHTFKSHFLFSSALQYGLKFILTAADSKERFHDRRGSKTDALCHVLHVIARSSHSVFFRNCLNFSSKIISTLSLTDSWVLRLFSNHHCRQSNGFSVKKPMSDRRY